MFTGIIEETGILVSSARGPRSCVLNIRARAVLDGTGPGDSIAVNGVCLTAATVSPTGFTADVMPETLARTGLGSMKPGALVNLERAMAADGRFGGHIVAGHVDDVGRITQIRRDDTAIWYTVEAKEEVLRYIVEKGSVALDGISLTVAAVTRRDFSISAIPHTVRQTVLQERREGDIVNVETDVIGKYIEKLTARAPEHRRVITKEYLLENGF